ncbi:MAG TPA: hypothetical protein ENI78_00425 [Euryarchaeota archaeon]|nr:hypothetical protein [Euryarchaeota archaeon]
MGIIKEKIEIIGMRKSKRISALFDSGAYRNYIRKKFEDGDRTEDIGFHVFEGTHRAILANGDIAMGERVRFKEVRIKERCVNEPSFVIMENLIEDVIIGVELMQKLGVTLDIPNEKICIRSITHD